MQKNHAKRTALALFLLFVVTVSAQAAKIAEVIPIGHTVGIKMQAEGVLIVQLTEVQGADGTHCSSLYSESSVMVPKMPLSVFCATVPSGFSVENSPCSEPGSPALPRCTLLTVE